MTLVRLDEPPNDSSSHALQPPTLTGTWTLYQAPYYLCNDTLHEYTGLAADTLFPLQIKLQSFSDTVQTGVAAIWARDTLAVDEGYISGGNVILVFTLTIPSATSNSQSFKGILGYPFVFLNQDSLIEMNSDNGILGQVGDGYTWIRAALTRKH